MIVGGALGALLAVVAGAFAAHALDERLAPAMMDVLRTAADYQIYHSLALLALAALQSSALASPWFGRAAVCFVLGMLLFSGSLYLLALSGQRFWGMLTPVGGILFLAGWAATLRGAWRAHD